MPPSDTRPEGNSWEHFHHEADVGIRGWGATPAAAFAAAAEAMMAVILAAPHRVEPRETATISCRAADLELLFYDWLNDLLWEMDTGGRVYRRFEVTIAENREGFSLTAVIVGEPLDRRRHRPVVEVKGATFTALAVRGRDDGSWLAQCVVDV
ncbi:MAG: archease [Deltaproteobacteria bacterium]|nr:archease [Candidatus Anaeroferrophillacea bacterium]